MITQKYLKEWLNYTPSSGVFTVVKKRQTGGPSNNIGDIVGSKELNGYITISLNGKRYKAHRLAWLFMYGQLPKGDIDHINRDKSDNRLSNLRDTTKNINMRNRNITKANTSGRVGVYYRKDRNYWEAGIKIKQNGKIIRKIKKCDSFEDACELREEWEKLYNFK